MKDKMKWNVGELDSIFTDEGVLITLKSDRSYKIQMKKKMINADGSDAGWIYYDIPNAYLNDDGVYVIMPPKW